MNNNKTPIYSFVTEYSRMNPLRLHMPGHKGNGILGFESRDITEISGADLLYHEKGIIKQSEQIAKSLFDTGETLYSTEGSSLPIRAMLFLVKQYALSKGQIPLILAGRNAHKVFITAAALLNINVSWIYPEVNEGIVPCKFSPEYLEKIINEQENLPTAVYITSPDYLGNIADIKSISEICHKYNILLITDNAHGSYLKFLNTSIHPIDLGADMCCDSAHKTLPTITGGAYLHISKKAPEHFFQYCRKAMTMFASTSPSYLILQSLDYTNLYLENSIKEDLNYSVRKWNNLKIKIQKLGFQTYGNEPLKLTIQTKPFGYYGYEIAEILEKKHIYCEYSDPDYLVFMLPTIYDFSIESTLLNALKCIPHRTSQQLSIPKFTIPKKALSPSIAVFSNSEYLKLEDCNGRILASPCVSCPPAIPIVICGEIINSDCINLLKYYGINELEVLKSQDSL